MCISYDTRGTTVYIYIFLYINALLIIDNNTSIPSIDDEFISDADRDSPPDSIIVTEIPITNSLRIFRTHFPKRRLSPR